MEPGLLTNREIAVLIWLGVLVAYLLGQPGRVELLRSFGAVARSAATPKLLLPFLLYFVWLAGSVWLALRLGLWNTSLLKPTVLWALFAGGAVYFSVNKALNQESFFKSALVAAVGASVTVEFFVSFQSFPLVVELVAQPIVALFAMVAVVAAREPGREAVVKLARWIVITFGFAAVAWVAWNVATRWQEIEVANVLRELLLPFWLTPIALLFVYALALLVGYEQAFARIDWKPGERSSWRQKLALLSVADIQLKDLRRISGLAQLQIAEETTFKGARRVAARAIKE